MIVHPQPVWQRHRRHESENARQTSCVPELETTGRGSIYRAGPGIGLRGRKDFSTAPENLGATIRKK